MESEERYQNMLLALGLALGSLRDPALSAKIVEHLRAGTLSRHYVEALRDELSAVLTEAEG